MKSNQVSVLVVLLLCLVMGGFLYVVDRSSDKEAGWTPSELYGELGARSYEGSSFSDVTFSGGGNSDGVAVSMRNASFSLRTRVRTTPSPNRPIVSSPNSPIANGVPGKSADFWGAFSPNSLIGHMTSSAEFHSFGGGSNMAMGSYTSSSNNLIASSPAIGSYSPSPSIPIALSPNASGVGFNNLPSLKGGDGGRPVVSAEQALISASSSASSLFGSALQTAYGTASYSDYVGMSGGKPSGIRGRQNAGGTDSWWVWLAKNGLGYASSVENEDGTFSYYYDKYQLEKAYNDFVSFWSENFGPENAPSFPEWLDWFMSAVGDSGYTYKNNTYHFVPIGNILPLFFITLIYAIILFVKRNKTAQL